MKETLTQSQFVSRFLDIRPDNFTRAALCALFDYFEEIEQDCGGPEMEFDPIAICCDYSEYETALEAAMEYGFKPDSYGDEDSEETAALEYLRDYTQVIEFDGGTVIARF